MARIDIGKLTQEETVELLRRCMDALPLDDVIQALLAYDADDRAEIIAHLEPGE